MGMLFDTLDDPEIPIHGLAENPERFLVCGAIVRGARLFQAIEFDQRDTLQQPGFVGFDRIPARLSAAQERLSRLTDQSLWDSPYLFAFVLACLSGEWGMRKRFGLA